MNRTRLVLAALVLAVLIPAVGCRRCCNDTSYKGCPPAAAPPSYYAPATGCP